jgi:hypothetical protein
MTKQNERFPYQISKATPFVRETVIPDQLKNNHGAIRLFMLSGFLISSHNVCYLARKRLIFGK